MAIIKGKKILIAASQSAGASLHDTEAVVASLAKSLVRHGATALYGGNLDPKGFTEKIAAATSPLSSEERVSFTNLLDEPSLILAGFQQIHSVLQSRQNHTSTYACIGNSYGRLMIFGDQIEFLPDNSPRIVFDRHTFPKTVSGAGQQEAFTFARQIKTEYADACVAVGGKTGIIDNPTDRYLGRLPGVAEEAIGFLKAGKPMITLGAYGGCAEAIAEALNLSPASETAQLERQQGFADAMTTLRNLKHNIPPELRSDLAFVARSTLSPVVASIITSIISRWDGQRPRNDGGSQAGRRFAR